MTQILRGTTLVAFATLISRILGFIRDLLVAALFGATLFADAFFVAFKIPNLLRSFVAEGALTSAFVPIFSDANKMGREYSQKVFSLVFTFLLLSTLIISAVGVVYAETIINLLAPGFKEIQEKHALAVLLTQIMLPYIIFVSLVALVNGALNTLQIFGVSAWAQVVMNLVLILGALVCFLLEKRDGAIALAISVILGGIAQILYQLSALKKSGLYFSLNFNLISEPIVKLLKLMFPAIIGASIYQISIFINTLFATLLPSGSVSYLFYADRVAQFPLGIFTIALSSVLLPLLSNANSEKNREQFNNNLSNSLNYTSFMILPFSAAIFTLAEPIVSILFERGAFSNEATIKTAIALQALSFGLWATSCHSMLVKAFLAKKDTVTPTLIGLLSLIIGVISGLILMGEVTGNSYSAVIVTETQRLIRENLGLGYNYKHVGLAISSSIAAFVSLVALFLIFILQNGTTVFNIFIKSSLKAFCAAVASYFLTNVCINNFSSPYIKLTLGLVSFSIIYLSIQYLLKSSELTEAIIVIRKKLPLKKEGN